MEENTSVIENNDVKTGYKSAQERIDELRELGSRTPEQEEEIKKLGPQAAVDKKIAIEVAKRHQAIAKAERLERELEELKAQREKPIEKKQIGTAETITINGKEFYTDRGLVQLVNAGTMSQEDAYAHQEERREEKAVARLKQDMQTQENERIKEQTRNEIISEHPEWNPNHANHNPNDPLYKEASRIFMNGYISNPRGLKLALEDAKRILGKDYKRPDLTEELGVTRNQEPAHRQSEVEKKVKLSDAEIETAWSFYRTQKNQKTGKSYTQAEAIEAATRAKQARTRRV